ncbi:MAG: bifunctional folylpolyglutamate synthase/dihydrofolate synthase [Campylobacterota bacterium]
MKNFQAFIQNKEEFYKAFEFASVKNAYAIIKPHLRKKTVIQIVGTNGKGSTGRALAQMLHKSGQRVAHYSSPHINSLQERFWLRGENADAQQLQASHEKLINILGPRAEDLSYFEYLTLLFFLLSDGCDYIVLEAGLGGEFDATNVIENDLCIVTAVGFDHCDILGNSIEEIAATKMRACDNALLLAKQPYSRTYEVAKELFGHYSIAGKAQTAGFATVLQDNIQTAVTAFEMLGFTYDPGLLAGLEFKGRMQRVGPNITVDVGHNLLAARALSQHIHPGSVLIYNSFDDKDIEGVLRVLAPKCKKLVYLPIANRRSAAKSRVQRACEKEGLAFEEFDTIDPADNYLVFGSFLTVQAFLQQTGVKL